jgi:hypothetical protein
MSSEPDEADLSRWAAEDWMREQEARGVPHMIVKRNDHWEHLPADLFTVAENGTLQLMASHGQGPDGEVLQQFIAVYPPGGWQEVRNSDPATWLDRDPPVQGIKRSTVVR